MTKVSPKPLPTPLAMSAAPVEATPSPIPPAPLAERPETKANEQIALRPHPKHPAFPQPKVRLECRQLDHDGANVFFSNVNVATCLSNAVSTVLSTLYRPSQTTEHIPATRSVTLILLSMGGVANTSGIELDDDHKEIRFSLDYINGIPSRAPSGETREIQGVLVHEMVHCWQWTGKGTAPVGLTEGIADYVRLRAGLNPPHWKKEAGGQWDAGYQHTGYFLNWLEEEKGQGSVRKINDALRDQKYEDALWESLFGKTVKALWEEYQKALEPNSSEKTTVET